MKKAIVSGYKGMVGTELIELLIENQNFTEIISFVRRSSGIKHPKLNEQIVNFDKMEEWKHLVVGDVLFSTLGTTLAQAKSKANQFKIDFTFQFNIAEIASNNGVANYVLVSSAGANSKSKIFYSKMKGQLEDAVKLLPFKAMNILKPGQLDGNRIESRLGEKMALNVMSKLNKLGFMEKYKPIHARQVAQAMINVSKKAYSETYILDEVHQLAKVIRTNTH
jgi:uncharacterized protein YbjT (DUF2867 family)